MSIPSIASIALKEITASLDTLTDRKEQHIMMEQKPSSHLTLIAGRLASPLMYDVFNVRFYRTNNAQRGRV